MRSNTSGNVETKNKASDEYRGCAGKYTYSQLEEKELQDSLGDMGTVIDLTGCTLDNVLYEVSAQRPVIAKTGENSSVVIVGYDEYNTYLYDPATGQISPYGMNDSTALFESAGNVFLTYIENVTE